MRITGDAAQGYVDQRVNTLVVEGPGKVAEASWVENGIAALVRLAGG